MIFSHKKKTHPIFTCLFSMTLVFSSAVSFSQTLKILPMGNSITWGTNVSPDPDAANHTAYRYKLYQLLTQAGYSADFIGSRSTGYNVFSEAQHCGIPGITDDHLASILETGFNPHPSYNFYETAGPYLNYFPPDIILLEIGTNDVMSGDVYEISNEINRILNAVDAYETSSGKPVIVFVALIISTKTGTGSCSSNNLVNIYNSNLASVVTSRISAGDKLVLVDMQCSANIDYSGDMLDTYHPYPSGYEKMGTTWFNSINSLNSAPLVNDIPNQTRSEGTPFATINLSAYVSDNETTNADIVWTFTPASPQYLNISIAGQVATITPKDANWNGSETITFKATDKGYIVQGLRKSATDEVTFSVTPINDPPAILSQAASLNINEDNFIDLALHHFTVEDVDDPPSALSLITLSGLDYTFSGNRVTPAPDFNGSLNVNVRVSDGKTQSGIFQASVNVLPVNDPPYIILPEVRTAFENDLYSGVFEVHDVDNGDNPTLSTQSIPSWLSYNASTLTLSGTPGAIERGSHQVRMRASDGKSTVDSTFILTVVDVNDKPQFDSDPDTIAIINEFYYHTVEVSDADEGDVLTVSVVSKPSWMTFTLPGILSGQPVISDTGKASLVLEVTDGKAVTELWATITVRLPSRAKDDLLDESIRIYPNPAGSQFTIYAPQGHLAFLELIDMSGHRVYYRILSAAGNAVVINDYSLLPGVYFYRIITDTAPHTGKIILQ